MAAKIARYNGDVKAFALDAPGTERTLFGEVTQANDLTSQVNADYLRGWGIVGPADQPSLQDFNAMGFTLGQFIAYLHQVGVAEYNATQEYHLNSLTNSGGVLYVSLINANVGNNPSASPTQWKELYGQATETVRGTGTVATQAEAEAGSSDTDLMTPLKVKQAIAAQTSASTDGIAGAASKLRISYTGLSALAAITADSVTVKNSSSQQKVLNGVAVNPSLAASGANGLDTGTSAASTRYFVYVIWNGTTVAGLISLSATAPTMPAGYTHKARVGAFVSDGTANKYPLCGYQYDDLFQFDKVSGTNLAAVIALATGSTSGAMASASISAYVPTTAKSVRVTGYSAGDATAQIGVAPSTNYSIYEYSGGSGAAGAGTFALGALTEVVIRPAASTIAWQSNSANARLYLHGWRDQL